MDSVSPSIAVESSTAFPFGTQKGHKRTYQACEPCRNRKVKCDLGSVDAPSDPPCQRCKREKKHCFFTVTRRKRKAGEPEGPDLNDEYVLRNRRSVTGGHLYGDEHESNHLDGMGTYTETSSPLMTSSQFPRGISDASRAPEVRVKGEGGEVRNETAAALLQRPINQPEDALRLLVDAASRTESMDRNIKVKLEESTQRLYEIGRAAEHASSATIDPAIMRISQAERPAQDPQLKAALQAWSRLRFVRAGWFTAREGIAYLEYFDEHLAPLTPISVPNLRNMSYHVKLLEEEPMLTVTLLTITARYKKLQGPGGASRSIHIHQSLWIYLQGMITKMFWGQEQFGGGFCGAGSAKTVEELDKQRRGLRSLGTVESLLLLSDWHPRSMHFPPGDDSGEILVPLHSSEIDDVNDGMKCNPYASWIEPALRSDRMSWSLVGAAYNLSVELGVFDSWVEKGHWIPGYPNRASYDPDRADRVGRLLHIYVSQTSGRLGYPNMLPNQGNDMSAYLEMNTGNGQDGEDERTSMDEAIQRAWAELTAIMRQVNAQMFKSEAMTHELIVSGEYKVLVEGVFWPKLRQWLDRFDKIKVPPQSKTIIMMEYEYMRTYVNSLSLQAALEQTFTTASDAINTTSQSSASNPPALFPPKLVEISKQNAPYIAEVVDATRNVLRHVVNGLVPTGGLRHAPVRVSFRTLSAAMFLMKTFALGVKESEVNISLSLLNATIDALRKNVVDDVHLGRRMADLLSRLIASIGTKFVRIPVPSRPGIQRRHRASLSSKPPPLNHGNSHNRGLSAQNITEHVSAQTPPGNITSHADNTSINADFHFAPPQVDPNDPNIMIFPPPDYVYTSNLYGGPLSHHGQQQQSSNYIASSFNTTSPPTQQLQSPTLSALRDQYPPNQPYSPLSQGSGGGSSGGGYDWIAIDVNPLATNNGSGGTGLFGGGVGFGTGHASSSAWGNVFGPEISSGLEMLETLGADGFDFDGGGFGGAGPLFPT